MKLFGAMKVKNNELLVGGVSCSHLVREFGSPLYVMDEKLLINTCKITMIILNVRKKIIR